MKATLLQAGAQGRFPVETIDASLRAGRALRLALDQATQAAQALADGK